MSPAGDEWNNVRILPVEMEPITVTICTKSGNMLRES